jgi:predicted Zn-dependent protease
MDSAVQHCWGPRGTVNGRLLDAQKQIRCAHSHELGHIVLGHGRRRVVAAQRASPLPWVLG